MSATVTTITRVTLSNSGGELDHRDVEITDPVGGPSLVVQALLDMLGGCDLGDGDTVTVRDLD